MHSLFSLVVLFMFCYLNRSSIGENVDQWFIDQEFNQQSGKQTTNSPLEAFLTANLKCCPIYPVAPIYGGQPTLPNEFPFLALLHFVDSTGKSNFPCAGTLISDLYVLTAAHCVIGKIQQKSGNLSYVRLGEHDIAKTECSQGTCTNGVIEISIGQVFAHENFNDRTKQNDIALIRLARPFYDSDDKVHPVCLPWIHGMPSENVPSSRRFSVVGWGRTLTSKFSYVSNKLDVPLFDHETCIKKYARSKVNITRNQICAGGTFKQDACDGDSGGPLLSYTDNNCAVLNGIVSFGRGCGLENWPGVYTNVSAYRDWILDNVKG